MKNQIMKDNTESCFKNKSFFNLDINENEKDETYFVVGRTNLGARFYSETTYSYDIAEILFKDYCGVVKYFGGGEVELFYTNSISYNIIKKQTISF